jgi:hypothetical protein
MKSELHTWLEDLRREKRAAGASFKKQLEQEYGGRLAATRSSLQELQDALRGGDKKYLLSAGRETAIERGLVALRWCMELLGTGAGMDRVLEYLNASSPYRRALPCEEVSCQLFAKLVTQATPVEGSDAND